MDFKKLISKIESIDGPIETPNAPQLAEPIRLDEDTELRVLAGVTTLTESVIAEKAVSKAQQKFMGMVHAAQKGEKPASKEVAKVAKEMPEKEAKKFASTKHKGLPEKKTDESIEEAAEKKSSTWTDKSGKEHAATKVKGGRYGSSPDEEDDDDEPKSKKEKKDTNESFRAKFDQMVESMKVGEKKKSSTGGTIEKTKTGVKHTAGKKYGGDTEKADDKKEVKEAAKPDFLDLDKDGNKKEPMKQAAKDAKKGKKVEEGSTGDYSAKKARAGKDIGKPGKNFEKIASKAGKAYGSKERGEKVAGAVLKKLRAHESVEEAFSDDDVANAIKDYQNRGGEVKTGKAARGPRKPGTGMASKHIGGGHEKMKPSRTGRSANTQGKPVVGESRQRIAESVEQQLSFKDLVKLVYESGGQQQLDAVDKELFAWANRVAAVKIGEGMEADLYAGVVYERMGGKFEIYDVLSESHVQYTRQLNENVDPDQVEELLHQFRQGDISYEEFRDKLDGLEYTDYSMRQGEMGNSDRREQQAWDKEKDEWDQDDEMNRDDDEDGEEF